MSFDYWHAISNYGSKVPESAASILPLHDHQQGFLLLIETVTGVDAGAEVVDSNDNVAKIN